MGDASRRRAGVIHRLFSLFRGESRDIAVVITYAGAIGLCSLAVPIAVQALVSSVASASVVQPVVVLTALVGGVLAFAGIVRLLQLWVAEIIQRRIMVRCSISLARRIPQVEVHDFSESYGSDYVVRFMELFAIQKLAALILLDGSAVLFQILVGLVLVSFYHPFFLAFALVLVVLIGFIVIVLGIGGVRTSESESAAKYSVMAWLQALARHPETFKSASGAAYAVARMDQLVCRYLEDRSNHFSVLFRQNAGAAILQAGTSAALLGLGGWLVMKGQLTLGQLVAAELVFGIVLASVMKLGKQLEKFYDLSASVGKLDSLFNLPYEDQSGSYFGVKNGGVRLNVLSLSIVPTGAVEPLLEKVEFSLEPGEKAVLWGPNGSGKSFLADVINRSASPYAGRVEIDDHPVAAIHPEELRSELTVIRGIELFPGTLEENLLLETSPGDPLDLRRALTMVGLADRVYSLRLGTRSMISGTSRPFSSGEALRLMIARAILSKPRLLVIDGTLDAMDDAAQRRMLDLIRNELPEVTVLLLTHERSLATCLPRAFAIRGNSIVEVEGDNR